MPFLSNWPLLKRLSLAPFRRSLTISAFSASLRFKEGILRTGKRRGAEERGGYAVGEKDWRGRGWEGRSSGRDFLLDFSRLQISVSGRFKRGQF